MRQTEVQIVASSSTAVNNPFINCRDSNDSFLFIICTGQYCFVCSHTITVQIKHVKVSKIYLFVQITESN